MSRASLVIPKSQIKIVQIPVNKVEEIIGRNGHVINSIRCISHASIKIHKDQSEAIAVIKGNPQEIEKAEDLIQEIIAIKEYNKVIPLKHHHLQFFIENEGTKCIESVQEKSGALLEILDDKSLEPKLRISGTPMQIGDAVEIIHPTISSLNQAKSKSKNENTEELQSIQSEGSQNEESGDEESQDEEGLSLDEESQAKLPKDEVEVPKDEDKVPQDEEKVPQDEDKVPKDEDKVPIDEDKVPQEDEQIPHVEVIVDQEKPKADKPRNRKPHNQKAQGMEPPLIHNKIILMNQYYLDVIKQGTPQTKILPIQRESRTHLKLLDERESLGSTDEVRLRITGTEKEIANAEKLLASEVFSIKENETTHTQGKKREPNQ